MTNKKLNAWEDDNLIPQPELASYLHVNKQHIPDKIYPGVFIDTVLLNDAVYGLHIKLFDGGIIGTWDINGYYRLGYEAIEFLVTHFYRQATDTDCKNVCSNLLKTLKNPKNKHRQVKSSPKYISAKNGMLNIEKYVETGDLYASIEKPDPTKHFCKYYIDYEIKTLEDVDQDKLKNLTDLFSEWMLDDEVELDALQKLSGSILWAENTNKAQVWTNYSPGSSGKSSHMNLIKGILPDEVVSGVALSRYKNNFTAVELMGKLINVDDDATGGLIDDNEFAMIKRFSSNAEMSVDVKNRPSVKFVPWCTQVFNTNSLFKVRSAAVNFAGDRRWRFVDWQKRYDPNDPNTKSDVAEEYGSYDHKVAMLAWMIEGLRKWYECGMFVADTPKSKALKDEFNLTNSPFLEWVRQEGVEMDAFVFPENYTYMHDSLGGLLEPYEAYVYFCKRYGYNAIKRPNFNNTARDFFRHIHINNNKKRTFRKGVRGLVWEYNESYDTSINAKLMDPEKKKAIEESGRIPMDFVNRTIDQGFNYLLRGER